MREDPSQREGDSAHFLPSPAQEIDYDSESAHVPTLTTHNGETRESLASDLNQSTLLHKQD